MSINEAVRGSHRNDYAAHVCAFLAIVCAAGPLRARGESIALSGERIRVSISAPGPGQRELIEILNGDTWAHALDTQGPLTRIRVAGQDRGCRLQAARVAGTAIVTKADCRDVPADRNCSCLTTGARKPGGRYANEVLGVRL